MDREIVRRGLIEAVFVVLAGFSMGALVVVANFAEYGLWLSLDVGGTIIFVALAAGIAIGLRLQDAEPQFLVLAGFVASSIAIVIVVLSVYAPVFAGVVPSLEALGPSDSARAVIIFASLFLIPIHLVGWPPRDSDAAEPPSAFEARLRLGGTSPLGRSSNHR